MKKFTREETREETSLKNLPLWDHANSDFVGSCELAFHAQFWRLRGRLAQLRNCSTDLGSIARSVRLGGLPPRFANLV